MPDAAPQIPVTVLTGYLSSGKTTLLNRILSETHGKRFAVIVNEFGEVGIDNDLIVDTDEEIFEMNNGCICCTARGDLIRIIAGLIRRSRAFDGIVVETTGLADPAPVAQTFFVDDDVRRKTKLGAIVTVTDAKHLLEQIDRAPEVQEQLAFADIVLVNNVDLVDAGSLAIAERRIRAINPYARVHRTEPLRHRSSPGLGTRRLQSRAHPRNRAGLPDGRTRARTRRPDRQPVPCRGSTAETRQIRVLDSGCHPTLRDGHPAHEEHCINRNDDRQFVVQSVHMLVEGGSQRLWKERERRQTRLVFIGRDLPGDLLGQGWAQNAETLHAFANALLTGTYGRCFASGRSLSGRRLPVMPVHV